MKKTKKINVLIIEDHPFISEAYKNAFIEIKNCHPDKWNFSFLIATNCDEAIKIINDLKQKKRKPNLVFLDIKLPPAINNEEFFSGEDLGIYLREIFPLTRIIVSTTHNNNFRIHNIFKNINPDGFLVKNDIDSEELIEAIISVLTDPPYYTKTIIKLLRSEMANDYTLDSLDRQLLYLLSIGTRIKDLSSKLPLSQAGIEKRKRILMDLFGVNKESDKTLIQVAREKGFV